MVHTLTMNLKNQLQRGIELPDESYSILDIQDYFQYISKKHKRLIILH